MITDTIAVEEVLWLLAALPGLYLWVANTATARHTLRAAKHAGIGNGRLLWARFAAFLTTSLVVVEFGFVSAAVLRMFRLQPAPDLIWANLTTPTVLLFPTVALAFLALRWRQVDETLIAEAQLDRVEAEAQQMRGRAQDTRSLEQDTRSMRQSERGVGQDERGAEQDAHGIDLDERERHIREQGDQ